MSHHRVTDDEIKRSTTDLTHQPDKHEEGKNTDDERLDVTRERGVQIGKQGGDFGRNSGGYCGGKSEETEHEEDILFDVIHWWPYCCVVLVAERVVPSAQ